MGNSASSGSGYGSTAGTVPDSSNNNSDSGGDDGVICLDCDKKNQKDLPTDDPVSQKGQPCAGVYQTVSDCMTKHEGQISSCTDEWDSFRKCHQQEQQQQ
mmetsp:Transcript_6866/g.13942  ORF Transcript_6866/g.13942 Transcript_6866/m.13942 type:complete len:100 (-) Transcript_6866:1554-1853(-)